MNVRNKISIIIPCYFNELNIETTAAELFQNENRFPAGTQFEYVFIDDGSHDKTMNKCLSVWEKHKDKVIVGKLTKNVGTNNAVLAGLHLATGDCVTVISADLQDPPELIAEMFSHWQSGKKLVIASRADRKDSFFDKLFANVFHKVMKKFVLPNAPMGGFDFVLFDQVIQKKAIEIGEKNAFLPFLYIWMGYDYINIPYVRRARTAGKSRWTFGKKLKAALDSILGFSFLPIRAMTVTGFVVSFCSLLLMGYVILAKVTGNVEVEGWTAMFSVMLFMFSVVFIFLGIMGEYMWRIFEAVRNRPNFIFDSVYKDPAIDHRLKKVTNL